MTDPVAKLNAIQSRISSEREENRRRFPTVAQLVHDLAMFKPVVMEASENGNYVRHKSFREGVVVEPYIDTRRAHCAGIRVYPSYGAELAKKYGRAYLAQLEKENE